MTWTLAQKSAAEATGAAGTVTPTLPAGSTAGNLLVACLGSAAGASAFSGPAGWIQGPAVQNGAGARSEIWYYPANPGGISSAAFTSGAGQVRGNLSEFSTDVPGPSVTLEASGTGTAGAVTTCTATATGANSAGDLSVCTFEWHQTVSATLTWTDPANFILIDSDGGSTALNHGYGAYQLSTAAGTLAPTVTGNNAATTWTGVVAAFLALPAASAMPAQPGRTWLRYFRHPIWYSPASAAPAAVVSGPPVYPLQRPVRAQIPPGRNFGRTSSRAGAYGQLGPAVRPLSGPVRGQPARPLLTGRTAARSGPYGGAGAAARVWHGPVRGQPAQPVLTGRAQHRTGVLGVLGPVLRPVTGPVRAAQAALARLARVAWRSGTFTAAAPQAGPPVYPLGRPVRAQIPPGRVIGRVQAQRGPAGTTGPPVKPLSGPVTSRRPPIGRTGRVQALRGPSGGTGPPLRPLGGPVRILPRPPARTGRSLSRAGVLTITVTGIPGCVTVTNTAAAAVAVSNTAPAAAVSNTQAGVVLVTDAAPAAALTNAPAGAVTTGNQACPRTPT